MRRRIHHTAKWRRLVRAIKRRGGAYSPYAVATARLGPSRLNPFSSKTKRRALRLSSKLAYRIWQSVKTKGYAIPVPKRIPKLVKKLTRKILAANGIKWTIKNPPKNSAPYGTFRDFRKIELFVNGKYAGTTTWARNLKEAKRAFLLSTGKNARPEWVTARYKPK